MPPQVLETKPDPEHVVVPGILSHRHLKRLYANLDESALEKAKIGKSQSKGVFSRQRINRVLWLNLPEWNWLYDHIIKIVRPINDKYWRLNIDQGLDSSSMQFSRYDPGEHYNWHMDEDLESGGFRTMSVVILLQEAEEGGGLETWDGGVISLSVGDGAVFPSVVEHRALKIIKGTRDSLVLWLCRTPEDGTRTARPPQPSDCNGSLV